MAAALTQRLGRLLALLTVSLFFTSTGSAYYYYVHYASRNGPYTPIVERFDLNSLTNNTILFQISDRGASAYASGDSFAAVVSEIRTAAQMWNNVQTSALRLSYGGLYTTGTTQNTPVIDVDFSDDITPGLLAISGPEIRGEIEQGPSGKSFVPILRSRMLLKRDLSQLPSYGELFFTTVVHEFGHTLGLQHTLASSVMSTAYTSASTKAMPLQSDDIAGISLLYPAANYLSTVGSISGRVTTTSGAGVNLASVVAISTSNSAVTALTNPDGTFEIDGLQPMQYYLYVHALPPAAPGESYPANITPQLDPNGVSFSAAQGFGTQFYPGTRNFNQAQFVFVYAGNVTNNVNFNVSPQSGTPIAAVQIYGYSSTSVPLPAAQLFVGVPVPLVAGSVTGGLLQSNGTLAPGLSAGMMGTPAVVYNLQPWSNPFVAFDVSVNNATGPGPKHMIFSTANDLYVRPSAFTVVQNPPPSINSISPQYDNNGNRIVAISGSNLQSDTRIFFDGLPGAIEGFDNDGRLLVLPPPALGSYTASVVAVNTSDPQSSLFVQPTPQTFTYDPSPAPILTIAPQYLNAGVDTLVDVTTANPTFDSQVVVGFGSSDVVVKQVTVISPTHISIVANTGAAGYVPTANISITDGLRVISQNLGFQILAGFSSSGGQ